VPEPAENREAKLERHARIADLVVAFVCERAHVLGDEQRVARGSRHSFEHLRARIHPEDFGNERRHSISRERAERQARATSSQEIVDQAVQAAHVVSRATRGKNHDGQLLGSSSDGTQRDQCGGVGPVEVLDRKDQRAIKSEALDDRAQRLDNAELDPRSRSRRARRGCCVILGEQGCDRSAVRVR
jgi:hypothetical protein